MNLEPEKENYHFYIIFIVYFVLIILLDRYPNILLCIYILKNQITNIYIIYIAIKRNVIIHEI